MCRMSHGQYQKICHEKTTGPRINSTIEIERDLTNRRTVYFILALHWQERSGQCHRFQMRPADFWRRVTSFPIFTAVFVVVAIDQIKRGFKISDIHLIPPRCRVSRTWRSGMVSLARCNMLPDDEY